MAEPQESDERDEAFFRDRNRSYQTDWLKNEDNVFKRNKKRFIKRIQEGNVPSYEKVTKYKMTEAQVNEIRRSLRPRLPPIKLCGPDCEIPSTVALVGELNKDRAEQEELERQLELARDVRAKLRGNLEQAQNEIRNAAATSRPQQGVVAPARAATAPIELDADFVTFNDIREYFFARSKNNPKKHKITTAEGYFGVNQNTGQLNLVLDLMKCKHRDNVIPCFSKMNDWLPKIANFIARNNYSVGYHKGLLQVILVVFDQYLLLPGMLSPELSKKLQGQRDILFPVFDALKTSSATAQITAQMFDKVSKFSDIKKAVEKQYKKGTQEHLFINLYDVFPCRDDFGDLEIVSSLAEANNDDNRLADGTKDQNYCVLNNREVRIILNVYKTDARYGQIVSEPLPDDVAKLIRTSVAEKPREYLFIKNEAFKRAKKGDDAESCEDNDCKNLLYSKGTLSSFVSAFLKKAGVKQNNEELEEAGGKVNKGAISLLRHAKISEYFKTHTMTEEARTTLAKQFMHSPLTSQAYVRQLEIDKMDFSEMEKVEEAAEKPTKKASPNKTTAKPAAPPKNTKKKNKK